MMMTAMSPCLKEAAPLVALEATEETIEETELVEAAEAS
jgi:hypothetical protein